MLAAAEAVGARGARTLHARDDDRHERPAGTARRADGPGRDRGVRARPAPQAPGPGPPLPSLRATPGAARTARALVRSARPHRPRGRAGAARPRLAARSRRRGGDRDLPAVLVPRLEPRARGRRGAAPTPSECARRCLLRIGARVPRVRARLHDRGGRLSRTVAPQLPARALRPLRGRGAAGAARDALLRRRRVDCRGGSTRGARTPLRAGCRRRRREPPRPARGDRKRDRIRHGRNVDGRLRDRRRRSDALERAARRRAACSPADTGRAHGRRGRRARSSGATQAAHSASGRRARAPNRVRPATAAAASCRR